MNHDHDNSGRTSLAQELAKARAENERMKSAMAKTSNNEQGRMVLAALSQPERPRTHGLSIALLAIVALGLAVYRCFGAEATLNLEARGSNVVAYVTGGESNVQYWVWTSNDNTVNSTNWYEWRWFYSADFSAYNTEIPVFATNSPPGTAASNPMRFFNIRGALTTR